MSNEEIKSALTQFTGTATYYKHPFGLHYTDGIKFLADECKCYWLIDFVASWQIDAKVRAEEFQVYKMTVKDSQATINIEDGNDNVIRSQEIEYTDFPLDEITLWFSNGVLYLPTEH